MWRGRVGDHREGGAGEGEGELRLLLDLAHQGLEVHQLQNMAIQFVQEV